MKIPLQPPKYEKILKSSIELLVKLPVTPLSESGEYIHWDKLRHLHPPTGLTSEQWWCLLKYARKTLYKNLPFNDTSQNPFVYAMPDLIWKKLHEIDKQAGNMLQQPEKEINENVRDNYITQCLIEEAITSSQLEGASTTRKVAKEMLLAKRQPKDLSEQMIFNNYEGLQFVREMKDEKLTVNIILELHRILSKNTLDDAKMEGRIRTTDDVNVVDNRDNTTLHIPPKHKELKERLKRICDFANADYSGEKNFIHPVVKAIILHFILAYDHPFVDGNGRTARALFYWCMANQGYWLMEYISISERIKKSSASYAKAFLLTETDDSDVTYFIVHQLDVIIQAINHLFTHLKTISNELKKTELLINENSALQHKLNYRQIALIKYAIKHPAAEYLVTVHQQFHGITYETARTDLLNLTELGLLIKRKKGKAFVFVAPANLIARIEN